MADIVKRLRAVQLVRRDQTPLGTIIPLVHEAADEIERLRAEVAHWNASFAGHVYVPTAEYSVQVQERDRLRAALDDIRKKIYVLGTYKLSDVAKDCDAALAGTAETGTACPECGDPADAPGLHTSGRGFAECPPGFHRAAAPAPVAPPICMNCGETFDKHGPKVVSGYFVTVQCPTVQPSVQRCECIHESRDRAKCPHECANRLASTTAPQPFASRSVQRRIALQKGEPMPTFDGDADTTSARLCECGTYDDDVYLCERAGSPGCRKDRLTCSPKGDS